MLQGIKGVFFHLNFMSVHKGGGVQKLMLFKAHDGQHERTVDHNGIN